MNIGSTISPANTFETTVLFLKRICFQKQSDFNNHPPISKAYSYYVAESNTHVLVENAWYYRTSATLMTWTKFRVSMLGIWTDTASLQPGTRMTNMAICTNVSSQCHISIWRSNKCRPTSANESPD